MGNDRVSGEQPASDTIGYSSGISADNKLKEKVKYAIATDNSRLEENPVTDMNAQNMHVTDETKTIEKLRDVVNLERGY